MLTSFFGTSKPINFIAVVFLAVSFFLWINLEHVGLNMSGYKVLAQVSLLLIYLFTIGVINFVVKRNTLTKQNTYILFIFVCFTFSFPASFDHYSVIVSGLFLMLALRRIISLRSQIEVKKKIFDAAFWIAIASIFYFWSILFLFVLYVGILFHGTTTYKNWLIPLLSILIVMLFCCTYAIYNGGVVYFAKAYFDKPTLDFTAYSKPRLLVPLSIVATFYIWCLIKYIALISSTSQKHKSSYILIIASSVVTLLIAVVFAPIHDGSEVYFFLGPMAIITARYIEKSEGFWFKEMILLMTLALPPFLILFT
tara:strand:+ start:1271 stop:2200 length:930 start_codon:yes stop_codon:yes gene_type:complete